MSIIIRLQHLPWNANAADIRQFFQNLTIPDGGVHIVGGENGDAFIAFGSDEDARQAMLLDGGKIKEAKIKLLLSSRTEMQKVIELARQQALTLQNLMQSMAAASTFGTSSLSMLPNMISGISSLPNLSLPVTAVTNVSPSISAVPAPPTGQEFRAAQANSKLDTTVSVSHSQVVSKTVKQDDKSKSRSRSLSSKSRSRSRSSSRSRDRRYRDRYRYRNRSRDRKWRRDRSRSKDRSNSRDRYRRKSRDKRSRDHSRDKDYKSKDRRRAYDKKADDKKEKSPIKDKVVQKKSHEARFLPISAANQKNEIKLLDVISIPESNPSPITQPNISNVCNTFNFGMTFNAKPKLENSPTMVTNKSDPKQAKSNENFVKNELVKAESLKTDSESTFSWMKGVPMPPMISSWMLSQTNDKSNDKEAEIETKPAIKNEEKVESNPPVMPFGMFPPQFSFGQGFPPPPAMYPFGGYATAGANSTAPTPAFMGADPNVAANMTGMPAMQMPSFFNPYQTASTAQPVTVTAQPLAGDDFKNSLNNGDNEPPEKIPRKEIKDEMRIDYNNYNSGNHDYKKYAKPNSYHSESESTNYNNGGFKNNDYRSRNDFGYNNKFYGYGKNSYDDDESIRKPYTRRNFNENRDNDQSDEAFDRRENYDYGDMRKNSSFSLSYPGSVCVEMTNLPRDAAIIDVKKFFSPLPLYESSIKFQSDGKGNRTRNAYVKFLNIDHKLQALKYSGKFLHNNRVTISDMDSAVWEVAEDYIIATLEQQFLKVSFIPKRAKKQDLQNAFPNDPDDLILMKDKNKHSLVAYIKFANSAMVKNALANKHKILICDSRVKLEPISEEDYLIARADYEISDDGLDDESETESPKYESLNSVVENVNVMPKRQPSPNQDAENSIPPEENSPEERPEVEEYEPQSKVIKSNCVLLENLPAPVTDKEIVEFFSDINVIPSQIHIMFDADYKQTGESFCEFHTEENAVAALSKNNSLIKDNIVSVTMVPKEDVLRAIGSPLPENPLPNPRFQMPPYNKKPYPLARPRAPFGAMGSRHPPPRGPAIPLRRPPGPEHFGKPGCVVALENVPYKADVDEILEFFSQFNVQRENVIRRFNENGLPTGDARVCLKNPNEAQKAVQYLDGKLIRDRVIYVSLM